MKDCLRCSLAFLSLLLPSTLQATIPEVTNIRANQRAGTKLIDVSYDVTGTDPLTVEIRVYDGNMTLPTYSLSGDVGQDVEPGTNKHIVWNAGQDWNRRFTSTARARVIVDDAPTVPPHEGMVFVPGGFGIPTGANYEIYTSAFFMDRYEVSKQLWDEVYTWASANGYLFDNSGYASASNHPVSGINWYDAVKWCNARSEKEGLVPAYYTNPERTEVYRTGQAVIDNNWVSWESNGYRLPTVAEWAKAYWGGHFSGHFYWPSSSGAASDNINPGLANYYYSRGAGWRGTTSVGYFDGKQDPAGPDNPNGYGLYDIAGNVGEWCWDRSLTGWFGYAEARDDNSKGPNLGNGMNRAWSGNMSSNHFSEQYYTESTRIRSPAGGNIADPRLGSSGTSVGLRPVRN